MPRTGSHPPTRDSFARRLVTRWLPVALAVAMVPASIVAADSGVQAGHGLLTVDVVPDLPSQVTVDGTARNAGGVTRLELAAGDHEVCLSDLDGYLAPECETITVPDGDTVTYTARLQPAGTLDVSVVPASVPATVSIDGVSRDQGDTTVQVTAGEHEVCFEQLGAYESPGCETVTVHQSQTTQVEGTYVEKQPQPTEEPTTEKPTSEPTAEPTTTPTSEPQEPSPQGANLLSTGQHTFVGSQIGWTPQGNTELGLTESPSHDDAGALVVKVSKDGPWPDSTRTARVGTSPGSKGVPVQAGQTYSGFARVRPVEGTANARCELRWFDDSGKGRILRTDSGSLTTTQEGAWTGVTCAAVAPKGAATASLRVFLDDVAYGRLFLVDDAWLLKGGISSAPQGGTSQPQEPAPQPEPEPTPTAEPQPTAEPEPTAEPAPQPTSDPQPPPSGHPGPDNTGVRDGSKLAPSGSITTSRDGQVIENVEVTGSITVQHSNVTIRNVRVRGTGRYGIYVPSSLDGSVRNLVIEDTQIVGVSGERSSGLVHYGQWTARRVDISGYADGVKMRSNQILESSWIHDLYKSNGSHNDAIQSIGGRNSVIRNNTIEGPWRSQTSAILLQSNSSSIENWVIEGNRLVGGNFTLYLTDKGNGHGAPRNVTVRNNVWVRGSWQFGELKIDEGPGLVWSGNRYDDGSAYNR